MKAAVLDGFGADSSFEIKELESEPLKPNDVRIKVAASSVNVVDTKIRGGMPEFAPESMVLGCDVAGTIVETGQAVTRFSVGDAVYGCAGGIKGRSGAYAEEMVADHRLLATPPTSIGLEEAASLPLVTITAWESLVDRARVQPGDRVLVHGGTGGVGHIGVQLARAMGAHVTATVSSDEKGKIAASLGADVVVNYTEKTPAEYTPEITEGNGFDVVFDTVGGPNIEPSLAALGPNGRCVSIVSLGSAPDLSALHLQNASLHVVFMLVPMLRDKGLEAHGTILERTSTLVDGGRLRPLIDRSAFSLHSIERAHHRLNESGRLGKVIIRTRGSE